jgi:hypothetical protein
MSTRLHGQQSHYLTLWEEACGSWNGSCSVNLLGEHGRREGKRCVAIGDGRIELGSAGLPSRTAMKTVDALDTAKGRKASEQNR